MNSIYLIGPLPRAEQSAGIPTDD